jgi:hypothetical protein
MCTKILEELTEYINGQIEYHNSWIKGHSMNECNCKDYDMIEAYENVLEKMQTIIKRNHNE